MSKKIEVEEQYVAELEQLLSCFTALLKGGGNLYTVLAMTERWKVDNAPKTPASAQVLESLIERYGY